MNVGFVGFGKLGLPCALAMEAYGGHQVFGYEVNPEICENIRRRHIPYREAQAQELLERSSLTLCTPEELVSQCELIFFAIQTPHDPRFEGITPLPEDRADFDYSYLRAATAEFARAAQRLQKRSVFVVISTVLPGTMDREIRPLLNEWVELCYNPFFIAMGTTIPDFMAPEFVLVGYDDQKHLDLLRVFYGTLHSAPVVGLSIRSAELTKVAYNTFIGMKIVFANTMMEISEATGANVDDVTGALSLATGRLLSPRYLTAGMGDGGGCHPRDNIAMSWLARNIGLSYDFFESLMLARERQTAWIAELATEASRERNLPIVVLGRSFKPETSIVTGSPAMLLLHELRELGAQATSWDPFIDGPSDCLDSPAVFVAATKHELFRTLRFPRGSVVIDPWRFISAQDGVLVKGLGCASPVRSSTNESGAPSEQAQLA